MHFGKSHLEDKREDLRSHYGKIEKTAGVTALRIAFCLLLVVLVCGAGLVIGAVRGVIDSAPDISEANIIRSATRRLSTMLTATRYRS